MTIKRGSRTAQSTQHVSVVRATVNRSSLSLHLELIPNLVCLVGLPIDRMKCVIDVMLNIADATAFICFLPNHATSF